MTPQSDTCELIEVSCIQYQPFVNRSKNEAERIAILEVGKSLRKRGYDSGIFQYRLSHRSSGHIHVVVAYSDSDERLPFANVVRRHRNRFRIAEAGEGTESVIAEIV